MSIDMITVKPANSLNVRKPDGDWLARDGETVEASSYWHRRIKDGDVVIVAKPAKAKAKTGDDDA